MPRTRPLALEQLEDRLTPTTWFNPWPDGQHLTVSFAKDGTAVAGQTSALFSTLNKVTATATWQTEILRALQTWTTYANLNIGLVADQGQEIGAAGRLQGDERFGDIRIAGASMSKEVHAIASPFAAMAGTSAGDIKFNTNVNFSIGSGVDLFSIALHEAGHSLGLEHSDDPTSVMYEKYLGPRTGPSAKDIAVLQALYGARSADAREGFTGNNSFNTAASLTLIRDADGYYGIGADGDITTTKDDDHYRFIAPNSGTLQVAVKTSGLSLLAPKVTVFDGAGRVIASASDSNPLTGDVELNAGVSGGRTYFVKVEGARNDVFGVGSYQMSTRIVPFLSGIVNGLLSTLNNLVGGLLNNDNHTNDSFATASLLPDMQTPSRFDYAYQGSISDSKDVDYYQITAPVVAPGAPNVMTVMVWGLKTGGLKPNVRVYDALQRLVSAETLVNENGTVVLQIAKAMSGGTYYVEVAADNPSGANNVGNYFLGVDFGKVAEQLLTFAKDTLSATNTREGKVLNVHQTKLFHFVLGANATSEASVRLTIYNQKGVAVGSVTAARGKFASITLTLVPGAYWFCFEALAPSGMPVPNISYQLRGTDLSDPIGPTTSDSTEEPSGDSYTVSNTSQDDGSWNSDWYASYNEDQYCYEDPYSDPYQ